MNKFRYCCIILPLICTVEIHAQDYSANLIPDSLKANAHYVIRDNTQEIKLKSVNSGTVNVKMVMTILDKEGESMAYLSVPYDKNSTVNIKQIILYDSNGKKIKNVKQSDITDSPAYSSSELFSDSRIKYYRPNYPAFPYTVLFEYDVAMKNIISLGCWRPFGSYNVSTQHASLRLIYPSSVRINRKEINVRPGTSEHQSNANIEVWQSDNLVAIEDEPFNISLSEVIPCVYLMPSRLIYDKFEGLANTWEEYGSWMYSLYQGRDILTDPEKVKISALLNGIKDTVERISRIYKYVQENTRYVNISLGIGGYQPFDAKTVFETGYGDCKALTNYMYSLLKYIGVKSYPAIVSSGRYKESIFTDFPNFQQFDHVILCVPGKSDTLWLECTDQKTPFGFIGDFTDDRDVLLITENGGKFAHTHRYDLNDNIRSCRSELRIDSTGTATCSLKTTYRGLQYDIITGLLNSNPDEQKKWLYSNSTLPSLQIKSFSVNDFKGMIPVARIDESEISKSYCSFSGNYMILPLNLLNSQNAIQKMLKPRYTDIIINRSAVDYDTLIYIIPRNYMAESIPAGTTISSRFGSYVWSVAAEGNRIIYIRKFTLLEGRYKPSFYKELYDFILAVSKADNSKIILSRKS